MNASCIGALTSLAFLVGCSNSESTQAHAITSAVRNTFKTRCAPCHGETGHGDGPAVVKLGTKPPSFADRAWQKIVTDEEIRKAIVYGGVAVGKGSAMPAVHDLEGKPELDELLALVRSFGSE
jgi:mono/diheme cytochrome c family protein